MRPAAHILLLSNHRQTLERWAEMLASASCRLWKGVEELADDAPLDVLVTDRQIVAEALESRNPRLSRGEIAVVAVGCGAPADVSLPLDCSRRELRLACLLLAEIVRLRRHRRRGRRIRVALSRLALSDPLTGLPNRRAWDEELQSRIQRARSTGATICMALVDVDHFKRVNDERGHLAGDDVLKRVGAALVSHVRRGDFVARLGGDEFGLLVSNIALESAEGLVERLRHAVWRQLSESDGPALTVSAGLATDRGAGGALRLFDAADQALKKAKAQGRDRTMTAPPL